VGDIRVVDDEGPRRNWAARILAPLAFFAAATVLVLIVNSAMNAGRDGAEATPPAAPDAGTATGSGTATEPTTTNVPRRQRRFYRIRSGDTLEQIAARFDTTVDDLLRINPGIDAQALTPGQRIRVR
jgi:Tfp pilus assembly protein FimV